MSKYTAEQVESAAEILEQDQNAPSWMRLSEMLYGYAALLRERESAQPVAWLDMGKGEAQLIFSKKGDSNRASRKQAAHLFETVEEGYHPLYLHAPMLASARVPEEMKSAPSSPLHPLWGDGFLRGWNACRDAMLAAAPKPETIWPKNAREKAFSLAREMLKKGSAKPEKE